MNITKYGHCCLLIEVNGVRMLTDPGSYSTVPENLGTIDAVLITHEHQDHLHIETLKRVIAANPDVEIYTNPSVGKLLGAEGIKYETLVDGGSIGIEGVAIDAHGTQHAVMHADWPRSENTGFFINHRLFYPGDALTNPGKAVEILALPVAGPWVKLSEAIEYAKGLHPKVCFPVHDGILKQPGSTNTIPPKILEPLGIQFRVLEGGAAAEFA